MLARGGVDQRAGFSKVRRSAMKVEVAGRCRWDGLVLLWLSVSPSPRSPVGITSGSQGILLTCRTVPPLFPRKRSLLYATVVRCLGFVAPLLF